MPKSFPFLCLKFSAFPVDGGFFRDYNTLWNILKKLEEFLMTLFSAGTASLAVSGVTFLVFCVLAITAIGYALGRITIKGVNLGTAGVFLVALIFGCVFYKDLDANMVAAGLKTTNALKIIENIGLIFFVSAVGFIAGPNFIANFKKNFKSYVLLGAVIIVIGGAACMGCLVLHSAITGKETGEYAAIFSGLLAGALTSTPAFSAAKAAAGADMESLVAVGYGIAYIFGVIGVVLFVQLMPKFLKADMDQERALVAAGSGAARKLPDNLLEMDDFNFMPFALASLLGILLGSIKIGTFSLTTTGGCLIAALAFGHFGHVGKISIVPNTKTLKVLRELGLMLFLIGAGIAGGQRFLEVFDPMYLLYGAVITIAPMVIGFYFAKYVLKISLLNNLGSITGGMTSTPALGTLVHVAGTDDVAAAYAATYPVALIAVVLVGQWVVLWFT